MIEKIDHEELAISRLATQFREAANLIAYIQTLLREANNLEDVFFQLLNERSLDTAIGAQLDIIGEIVGQSRILVDAESFKYFGFEGNPSAQSFGSVNDPAVGGRFVAIGEPTTGFRKLSDDEYRLFIRARITKNRTSSTPEEIIAQIKFIFDAPLVVLVEGNTSYTISIGKILSPNEKAILENDIIPKTLGVKATYVSEFDPTSFFGFSGMPGSGGFGSVNDPFIGGKFAQLI